MRLPILLLLSLAVLTVKARHRKEWKLVNTMKASREIQLSHYNIEASVCVRGPGFYRDPKDCHQYIRCVDEYSTGRRMSAFIGRCDPGLVFDQNVSSCNWPELAAPCSDSPEKFREPPSKIHSQQESQNTDISQKPDRVDKPSLDSQPSQQQVHESPQTQTQQQHHEFSQDQQQVQIHENQNPERQQHTQQTEEHPNRQEEIEIHNVPIAQTRYEIIPHTGFQEYDATQKQISSSGFKEIMDDQVEDIPSSQNQDQNHQQEQEWWIPETESTPRREAIIISPPQSDFVEVTATLDDPIICQGPGFFRHPTNCSRFVKCIEENGAYSIHFFECNRNLLFDDGESYCTRSSLTNCNPKRSKRQAESAPLECRGEGFFRHPVDCKSFYRCVVGATGQYETHMFSCPETLVFDEEYATCNWPDKAPPCQTQTWSGYQPRRTVPPPKSAYKPIRKATTASYWTTLKPRGDVVENSPLVPVRGISKSTKAPTRGEQLCSSPGFFRHERDCTKFYKCVRKRNSFIRYEISCPNSLAFDAAGSRCVPQKFVSECNKKRRPSPPRQDDEGTSPVTEATRTTGGSAIVTESSDSDSSKCQDEGYFRNPSDCNRFYRCVDFSGEKQEFVRYDFKCPDGLVFDETNNVCNWPDQSAPCEGGSEDKDNTESSKPSESSTEKDAISTTTMSPSSSGRTTQKTRTTTTKPTQAPSTTEATTENQPSEDSSDSGDQKPKPDEGDSKDGCEKEGFFRNPEDCNKFYRCVDFSGDGAEFVRYDFSCPDGLVFDEENSVCNWPEDSAPCDSTGEDKDKDKSDGEDTSSSKGGKDSTTESSTTRTTTSGGKGTTSSRTDGPKTSSATRKPGRTTSSKPSSTRSPSRSTPSSSTEGPEDSSSTTPSSSSSSDGSEDEKKNQGMCSEAGFFRDPKDCNKFYRCVDYNGDGNEFVKYDFSCPDGLVFDEENSVCNWPEQSAPCDGGSGKESSTKSEDSSSQATSTTQKTTSAATKSSDTTEESSSAATEASTSDGSGDQSTSSDKTTDSSDKRSSTTPSDQTDGESTTKDSSSKKGGGSSDGECTEAGFFRNPEDCNKFYRCVDFNGDGQEFVKYDFTCPEGLVFDETNSVCNWPEDSPPCDSSGGKKDEGSTESNESSTQSSSTSQSESSTSSTSESSTEQTSRGTTATSQSTSSSEQTTSTANDKEECTESGFFRCKDDCSKFYRCLEDNGELKRYDFKCPEGLIFDDDNKRCDWPSDELTCESSSTTSSDKTTASTTQSATSTTRRTSTRRTTPVPTTKESTTTSSRTTTSGTTRPTRTTRPSRTTTTSRPTTASDRTTTQSSSSTTKSDECTEEGFYQNPDDCSKYYRCIDEGDGRFTREDFSCADDEVFDEEMRFCNSKDLAPPCEKTTTGTQITTSPSGTSSGGIESSTSSTNSGRTTTSSSSTGSEKGTTSTSSSECTEEGFTRDSGDCMKFYRCVEENGEFIKYNFTCPEGLIFYLNNERCDSPSSELTCDTETSTSTTSSGGSTTSSESGTPGECTEEGFFRDPNDCSKYYRCLDEGDGRFTREDFSCAEDEIFDEEMRYCNRKDLAPPCDESSTTTTSSTKSETSTESGSSSTVSSSTGSESSTQTTSSGTDSTKEGDCEEEGFHRDSEDCRKFYRCVDFRGDGKTFTKYDFECPDDLVFDDSNNVCNWPSAVRSCESSGGTKQTTSESTSSTSSGGTTRTTSSTTQNDKTTSTTQQDRTSTTQRDRTSTTPSDKTTQTEGTTSTTQGGRTSTTPSGSEDENTSQTESGSTKDTTSTGDSSSQTTKGKPSDIECTEEGFFRNPDDCNKFYRCVDFAGTGESFVRYDFECPEGLVFDEVNSVCNWPEQSPACESGSKEKNDTSSTTESTGSSGTESSTTTKDDSTSSTATSSSGESTTTTEKGTSTTGSSGTSTTQTSTSKTESPEDFKCEEEGFFRDSKDCKKYYECKRDEDTGELVKIDCECPEGHVFDTDGWYCNAEELSPPCDDGSFKCTEEGFFRDPEDCAGYYHCNKTRPDSDQLTKERLQCPDGYVFDEEGRYCNAPELSAPCDNSTTAEGGSTTSGTRTTSSETGSTSSGSGRGTTSSGTSTTSSGTGTTSSGTSTTSLGAGTTSSGIDTTSSEKSGECTEEGFFRNPEDCTKYYQCIRNEETGSFEKRDFQCQDGRIFDEGPSYCNDPRLSDEPCETGSTREQTSTESSGTDSSQSTASESSTSSTTQSSSSSTGSSVNRKGAGDPECTEAGFFRHPRDCNKFYRCVDFAGTGESFVRFDFDCPEGLHFDEVNSTCNWPTMSPRCESESDSSKR
ncbi:mucin-22 [Parasteatoda tepidariorum]|uniref:mucin-22 n=1 Tax=Parasteatoda tepidariorum TaxID=114398 RepID=UPI001C7265B7|nr:serine-rich adhesin for platelets [Parasteatoda tepidariorum]